MASWTTALLLSLLALSAGAAQARERDLLAQWSSIEVAEGVQKHQVMASTTLSFGELMSCNGGYRTIARSGQVINGSVVGQMYDIEGNEVFFVEFLDPFGNETVPVSGEEATLEGVPNTAPDRTRFAVSHDADFTSILPVGDRIFMIAHFESPSPAPSYLFELAQDEDGNLEAISAESMDWSEWGGLWVPCAGSVTPWNTHLGSEEYEANARLMESTNWADFLAQGFQAGKLLGHARYFGFYPQDGTLDDLREVMCPFKYGYPTEVREIPHPRPDEYPVECSSMVLPSISKALEMTVFEDGSYEVKKHFAMGRMGTELSLVMPDNKTVYSPQDGSNAGQYMFVADVPQDLSSGELFAAKLTQTSAENGGRFDVEWISLGKASLDDLDDDLCLSWSDLFDHVEPNRTAYPENGCPPEYSSVNVDDASHECLIVKPGMELLASRYETRRYAAILGATTEISKHEGMTFNPRNGKLYTVASEVRNGMEDSKRKGSDDDRFDFGGSQDVAVPYNPCGCLYSMDVDENYQATNMIGILCGDSDANTDEFNSCNLDSMAAPDNIILFDNDLIIGEDATAQHQNDVVWHYNLQTEELTRILSTPYGSETTSPYWYPDISGYSYMLTVVQHPYGESDSDRRFDPEATGVECYIGYWGPCPAVGLDSTYGGSGVGISVA